MSADRQRLCRRCGAALSRYNTTRICTVCDRRHPTVPDDFWQRPDIRNALAAWDMGAVVRGFRQFTGASQGAVATLVNIDQAEVSRLERGRKRLRDRSQLLVWAKALGVPPTSSPRLPRMQARQQVSRFFWESLWMSTSRM